MAAALAERAVRAGKRVLAIDAVGSGGLAEVVARAGLDGRFDLVRLTTRDSLDQYLRIYLRLPIGPSRLRPLARIFDYVAAAAPGVRELLVIGKIGHEVRNGGWDEVVVDGPATGHVVELLTAPDSLAELIPTGPLAEQTGWLGEIIGSNRTGVVLVTVAEDLAASEGEELLDRIRTETSTRVTDLLVNRVPAPIDRPGRVEAERMTAAGSALAPTARLVVGRHDAARRQLARIARFGPPVIEVDERTVDPVGAVLDALDGVMADGARRR